MILQEKESLMMFEETETVDSWRELEKAFDFGFVLGVVFVF